MYFCLNKLYLVAAVSGISVLLACSKADDVAGPSPYKNSLTFESADGKKEEPQMVNPEPAPPKPESENSSGGAENIVQGSDESLGQENSSPKDSEGAPADGAGVSQDESGPGDPAPRESPPAVDTGMQPAPSEDHKDDSGDSGFQKDSMKDSVTELLWKKLFEIVSIKSYYGTHYAGFNEHQLTVMKLELSRTIADFDKADSFRVMRCETPEEKKSCRNAAEDIKDLIKTPVKNETWQDDFVLHDMPFLYGPDYGGGGGRGFALRPENHKNGSRLRSIKISGREDVRSIEMNWDSFENRAMVETRSVGRKRDLSRESILELDDRDYLQRIRISTCKWKRLGSCGISTSRRVCGVILETAQGKSLVKGSFNNIWNQGDNSKKDCHIETSVYEAPEGFQIIGLEGRSGDELDAIRPILTPRFDPDFDILPGGEASRLRL
ncbi:MAG: hypothetical protein HQK54_13940 [Oligoflexales bacterium]|nr:hypothetical protein [Oligoflexales bacterium]